MTTIYLQDYHKTTCVVCFVLVLSESAINKKFEGVISKVCRFNVSLVMR